MKKMLFVVLILVLFLASCDSPIDSGDSGDDKQPVTYGSIRIYNIDSQNFILPEIYIKKYDSPFTVVVDDTVNLQPGRNLSRTVPAGKYTVESWFSSITTYVYANETTELTWTYYGGFYER